MLDRSTEHEWAVQSAMSARVLLSVMAAGDITVMTCNFVH